VGEKVWKQESALQKENVMKGNTQTKILTVLLSGALILGSATYAMAAPANAAALTGQGKDVKNVILMISDGWGYNQIQAADYYTDGKAGTQGYEKFPTKVAMSTYSYGDQERVDGVLADSIGDDQDSVYNPGWWGDFDYIKSNPTDSAAAGTAMSTGTKTYDAAIGVNEMEQNLSHLSEEFEALGRSTGVVSSVEFAHATPASFVAHNASRNSYEQIAYGMIYNSAADVILGAGNPDFDDSGKPAVKSTKYVGGAATWAALKNGTAVGADADGNGTPDAWTLIQTKAEFESLTTGETPDRLIGVPQVYTTLQQARSGNGKANAYAVPFNSNLPDLATMSKVALNVLDNDEDGFFLMIEGGAIDWAGHANQSGRVIEEQEDFNKAVEAVCAWVEENSSWGETLVIVTGDHETGYLTGTPGVYDSVMNNGKGQMPGMSWNSGDHTNQLIPFYAKGAGAELFKKLADSTDPVRGAYMDNTEIAIAIRALIN
jgi:alkaline phosphatase